MNHRNNFLFVPNSIKLNGWFVQRQPPEVFYKKGVLRNFAKFTGKHLCQSLFFHKVAGLRPATSLKKRLWYRCFPVNFAKFLRTPFVTEHLWWLFLIHLKVSRRLLNPYVPKANFIYYLKTSENSQVFWSF